MAGPLTLDPSVFAAEAISPETAACAEQVEQAMATLPPLSSENYREARAARDEGQSVFGPLMLSELATERSIPGPAGAVPIRVLVPDVVTGVYLHLHGGGWVLGRPHHDDQRNEQIARECQLAVVSVDYRLAPEDPYPAGPDDCEVAALWLAERARAEFGTDRLLIGGESAGAHLSAVTLLRLRDRHGFTGFRGANLVYGAYDLGMSPSAARWGDRRLVLSGPAMAWFLDQFVPRERRRDPDVSPLYADLRGLPPALFTIGTLDPLLDDNLFMAARWLAAGNPTELAIYPGGCHAFNLFPIELARQANERIQRFLAGIG